MVAAFSAELASLEGKTACRPWMHHPVWNNDHWTVLQVFQHFQDLPLKSLPACLQRSNNARLEIIGRHGVFPHFWNLHLVAVNTAPLGVGVEWARVLHSLFAFPEMAICHIWTEKLPSVSADKRRWLCCSTWVITSRPFAAAGCTVTAGVLLSQQHLCTQLRAALQSVSNVRVRFLRKAFAFSNRARKRCHGNFSPNRLKIDSIFSFTATVIVGSLDSYF